MAEKLPSESIEKIISKFLINLSMQQLSEQRIGFHFERAYFYYIDIRDKNKKQIMQKMEFYQQILKKLTCPEFAKYSANGIANLIEQSYLTVPVNGIILLNMENTHVLLVESKDHGIYGFPKGKINQEESSESCAMRELREQIGLRVEVNPNQFVKSQIKGKINGQTVSKNCQFYICNIEQSCIFPRKYKTKQLMQPTIRSIIHSKSQIQSLGWYKLKDDIPKLIQEKKFNTSSKLAYYQLMKKNLNKKINNQVINPFSKFKEFDAKY